MRSSDPTQPERGSAVGSPIRHRLASPAGTGMDDDTATLTPSSHPVTFLGRGLGLRSSDSLTLLVCPLCSQRNGERMAALGTCVWCGYEPSVRDEEPAAEEMLSANNCASKISGLCNK